MVVLVTRARGCPDCLTLTCITVSLRSISQFYVLYVHIMKETERSQTLEKVRFFLRVGLLNSPRQDMMPRARTLREYITKKATII